VIRPGSPRSELDTDTGSRLVAGKVSSKDRRIDVEILVVVIEIFDLAVCALAERILKANAELKPVTRCSLGEIEGRVLKILISVRVGLAICFDLRFAELFRRLADLEADLIVVPSAFTFQTGADHWEILLRARAIETQSYVAAPGQVGTFDNGKYMNFGHSMIVDPWGLVVAQVSNGPGFASTRLDSRYMEQVRTRLPVRQNRVLV